MPIFCATDFSPCSRAAARVAAGLARRTGEPLVLAHVDAPEPANLAMMAALVEGMLEELRASIAAELASEATAIQPDGPPIETRLARAMNVDAVAVGMARHRFRHWTPIESKALLRRAGLPVFCIPELPQPG